MRTRFLIALCLAATAPVAGASARVSQVVVPLSVGVDVSDALVTLLGELVPEDVDGDGRRPAGQEAVGSR